jgi:hypothetical protein
LRSSSSDMPAKAATVTITNTSKATTKSIG